jgi:hypothetical protein
VVLPICVGVLSKKRSPGLTRNIFVTMIAASGLTLSYKFILFLNAKGWWSPLGENSYAFLERFDPSVFGVLASCMIFTALSLTSRCSKGRRHPGLAG